MKELEETTLNNVVPEGAFVLVQTTNIEIPINNRWMKIGRDSSNQIVLNADTSVSRYHAWITYEEDSFFLEDLGSTNGTLLNGNPVKEATKLASGDIIKVGETEMIFSLVQ